MIVTPVRPTQPPGSGIVPPWLEYPIVLPVCPEPPIVPLPLPGPVELTSTINEREAAT